MIVLAYALIIAGLLSVGILVASILPTAGARIGLGAVAFVALVVDGTWLLAPGLDWSASLVDAVAIGVFGVIGLVAAMTASYYRGAVGEPAWVWPSSRDIAFLLLVIVLFGAIAFVLPVPLDTDAQGFGYLALMLREGEDFTTLAPWYPDVDFLYSPAYFGMIAHLSTHFDLGLHEIMLVVSAAAAALFIWAAYDLGCEVEGPRTGRAFMLAALGGTGLMTAFMDSHYTAVLALTFSLGFLTFVLRFLKSMRWVDALFAAVCLAGVPLSQPDTTIALVIGYVPWLLILWLAKPRPSFSAWLVIAMIVPLVALVLVGPWLLSIQDLLGADIESPFDVDLDHWRTMVFMHGGAIVVLSILGVLVGLWRRHPVHLLAVVWLIGIVEFAVLGTLEKEFPDVVEPLLKYDYPFSLAWHGPIIPYIILGGTALAWWSKIMSVDRLVRGLAIPLTVLGLIGVIAGVGYFDSLLELSKDTPVNFYGTFSSQADVEAMEWLRENAPPDVRVLNHPGPQEGDWVPIISERDTIFFRPQPFFQGVEDIETVQDQFRDFWRDPADSQYARMLREAGVQFVIVPQVFGDPDTFEDMLRWREPIEEAASYEVSSVGAAPYLLLVYENDGAQVYALRSGVASSR